MITICIVVILIQLECIFIHPRVSIRWDIYQIVKHVSGQAKLGNSAKLIGKMLRYTGSLVKNVYMDEI